jgi:hypothetical protein
MGAFILTCGNVDVPTLVRCSTNGKTDCSRTPRIGPTQPDKPGPPDSRGGCLYMVFSRWFVALYELLLQPVS